MMCNTWLAQVSLREVATRVPQERSFQKPELNRRALLPVMITG